MPPTASQFDLLKELWERMAVEEIAMSIAYNGYFNHEPLFIQKNNRGQLVVFEGNRRLAAVRLLLSANLRKRLRATDLPNIDRIDAKRRKEIATLPFILTTPREEWRYLGFKHVNGPATWGSYAKAQYIAKVRNRYGVPLPEIAKHMGDYSNTVERMYHGLMVIEQAERNRVFDRRNTTKNEFYFNYIYTGLQYPGFKKFLGLQDKSSTSREPVTKSKIKQLGLLCEWLYGDAARGKESLIRTQNPDLKILAAVLMDPKGVKALKDGLPLDVANDITLGDERLFRTSVQAAKHSLQKAHGTLSTGYSPSDGGDAMGTAVEVERLASDLVDEMTEKRKRFLRPTRSGRVSHA